MLSSPGGFEGLEKIIDRSWPEEVFTSTFFEPSNLDTVAMEGDVALVVNPGDILDSQMNRKLADRIPALAVLSEEKLVEGQLEFVIVHTELVNRRGGNIGKTHTLYADSLTMDETGMTNVNAVTVVESWIGFSGGVMDIWRRKPSMWVYSDDSGIPTLR
nr:unnamed protein product [Callosobruchus chinensis]